MLMKHVVVIENVQRRVTKQVPGLENLPYAVTLQQLYLPTLAFRRPNGNMTEVFKILSSHHDPIITWDLFYLSHTNTQSHSSKLTKACIILTQTPQLHSVHNKFMKLLPDIVVVSPSILSFKRNLNKFWANHPLRYDFHSPALALSTHELAQEASVAYCQKRTM